MEKRVQLSIILLIGIGMFIFGDLMMRYFMYDRDVLVVDEKTG
jgi:hypothetical protein